VAGVRIVVVCLCCMVLAEDEETGVCPSTSGPFRLGLATTFTMRLAPVPSVFELRELLFIKRRF